MTSIRKEIEEKVEAGEIFQESRDWYSNKYVYSFIERSYLIALLLGVGFLIFLTFSYYFSITPIRRDLPVQVNITDAAEQYTRITYLGNKKKDFNVNEVLSKYLSTRFVEAFESYDYRDNFKKLEINRNLISSLGTEGIKSFYQDKTSFRNRDSLVLKYRKNVTREIFIDKNSIVLADNKSENLEPGFKDYTITLNFKAREITNRKGIEITDWQAKINVSFEEIYFDFEEKEFNDLNFKVYGYESNKI